MTCQLGLNKRSTISDHSIILLTAMTETHFVGGVFVQRQVPKRQRICGLAVLSQKTWGHHVQGHSEAARGRFHTGTIRTLPSSRARDDSRAPDP